MRAFERWRMESCPSLDIDPRIYSAPVSLVEIKPEYARSVGRSISEGLQVFRQGSPLYPSHSIPPL